MYNDNMSTNGRSIHRHLVTTSDPRRAALWDRIFGCEALPVKHHTPRWQERESGVGQVLAYDLDTARLTPMQRARFASHLARIERRSYAATNADVRLRSRSSAAGTDVTGSIQGFLASVWTDF